jgi:hypothetical protein
MFEFKRLQGGKEQAMPIFLTCIFVVQNLSKLAKFRSIAVSNK